MSKANWQIVPNTNDRKWELKHNGVVLATIFHKPNHPKVHKGRDMFSLYVASPKIYDRYSEVSRTHLFETFEEAAKAFDKLTEEQALPWAEALIDYFINVVDNDEPEV